jgi:histidinol phosphatase-like enzyme
MRAVFVRCQSILRDSQALSEGEAGQTRLTPATLEAMRQLGSGEVLVVVFGHYPEAQQAPPELLQAVITQIENAAGRVDIAAVCDHADGSACHCWRDEPGIIWVTAGEYGIDLASSYLVGDCVDDVLTAKAAGVRPILVLGARSIAEVLGDVEVHKDFGFAADLTRAAEFIATEQEIAGTVGGPRQVAPEIPLEYGLAGGGISSPRVTPISARARESQMRRTGARLQLGDITRWLAFLTVGGLGLSLGIAYLLTHLYRVQAFPAYVSTLTLQFIPRPIRGAIFVALGLTFVVLAVRSVLKSTRAASDRQR